ncbi:MAG: PAS domain S-box protein [Methanoregulaceae archaeon]
MTGRSSGILSRKPGEPPILWAAGIAVTLGIAFYATWVSYQTGFDISDVLFDIPIVLACYAFLRKGFYAAIGMTALYILTVFIYGITGPDVLVHAWLTAFSFVVLAVIVTWLSESLMERSLLYETFFEHTGTGMLIVEEDLSVRYANRMVESVLGIPRDSIIGTRKFLDSVIPEDRERIVRYHTSRLANEGQVPDNYEFRITDSRGDVQDIYINVAIIPGTKRIIASMLNITERKRSEQRTRKSEETLRSTLASMDDLVFSLDREDRFTEYYQPPHQGLYVPPDQFIRKNFRDVLPPQIVPGIASALQQVRETGTTREIDYSLKVSGKKLWFNARISPRHDATGSYDGAIIVARDVTVFRKVSQKNAMLAAIVTSSDDAIIGQKPDGTIWGWNPAAEKMYGYSAKEMRGQNIAKIIPTQIKAQMEEVYMRVIRGEHIDQFDTVRLRKDGSEVDVSFTISPIKDESGTVIGITTMSHDLTRQREEERALLAFITEAAMRLNNPVEQIAVNLSQIREQTGQADQPREEIALQIEIQRKHALQIVENLKDLNRAITLKIQNLPEAYREYLNK